MRLRGSFVIPADPARAWGSIFNDDTVRAWVPGGRRVAWVGDGRIEATVEHSLMGFNVVMEVSLDVVAKEPPERLVLRGHCHEPATGSHVEFELTLSLTATPARETLVEYENEATLHGPLATVGNFLLKTGQKAIEGQLVENLRRALQVSPGGATA